MKMKQQKLLSTRNISICCRYVIGAWTLLPIIAMPNILHARQADYTTEGMSGYNSRTNERPSYYDYSTGNNSYNDRRTQRYQRPEYRRRSVTRDNNSSNTRPSTTDNRNARSRYVYPPQWQVIPSAKNRRYYGDDDNNSSPPLNSLNNFMYGNDTNRQQRQYYYPQDNMPNNNVDGIEDKNILDIPLPKGNKYSSQTKDDIPNARSDMYVKLRIIEKTSAKIEDIILPPESIVPYDNLRIRVIRCWDNRNKTKNEQATLLQLFDNRNNPTDGKIFYGWLFSNEHNLSTVKHPKYDIIMLDCLSKNEAIKAAKEKLAKNK